MTTSSIDNEIPRQILPTGAAIPSIGLGTFGSDTVSADEIAAAVVQSAQIGYRHFDCASVYGNEPEIGRALDRVIASGIARDHLWITSKVWNDSHAPSDVEKSCLKSIADLGVEYLNAYLIHWPFPNHHDPGCDVEARRRDARPYIHDRFMAAWGAMESLVDRGLVRHIGTSNMTIPKLRLLLRDARIRPALNQMELHPHFQQPALFDFLRSQGIVPVGFSPLGSPGRPERDRTPEDTSPLTDPVITEIAERHRLHPAAVCLRWAVQRGGVVIPFSVRAANQRANLDAIRQLDLSAEEMQAIRGTDRNCRLIKGQVFLWKSNQSWRDLWDEDGVIPQ
jgi:alcohol dehydrogenase (NADP+)